MKGTDMDAMERAARQVVERIEKLVEAHGSVILYGDIIPPEIEVFNSRDGDVINEVAIYTGGVEILDALCDTNLGVWRLENGHHEANAGGASFFLVTRKQPYQS